MRFAVVAAALVVGGCAPATSSRTAPATPTMKVEPAKAAALDVEPEQPRAAAAPSPAPVSGGFAVDDHVGAHAVSRDAAIESIAGYEVFGAMRVTKRTADVVSFDVLNVHGAERATFGVMRGQIARLDPQRVTFAPGQLFVGGLALDPRSAGDSTAWALVPVENESEALEVMMKVAMSALQRKRQLQRP